MSKEEDVRTESVKDLVKRAFKSVREEKENNPVYLIKKAFQDVKEDMTRGMAIGMAGLAGAAIANRVAYCKEKFKDDSKKRNKCIYWYVKKEKEKQKEKIKK